jgi:hypothetical protein
MRHSLFVRGIESVADLPGEFERLIERQGTLERLPLDELHHQVIGPDVVQRADVRVIERSHYSRLALEAFGEIFLGDLDCDDAIQASVARLVHLSHAARADQREDFIGAEFIAWLERHLGVSAKFIRSESGYILDYALLGERSGLGVTGPKSASGKLRPDKRATRKRITFRMTGRARRRLGTINALGSVYRPDRRPLRE